MSRFGLQSRECLSPPCLKRGLCSQTDIILWDLRVFFAFFLLASVTLGQRFDYFVLVESDSKTSCEIPECHYHLDPTTRLVFTDTRIFLWYFWVFFVFLLLPSGTFGRQQNIDFECPHWFADRGASPSSDSCGVGLVIYFQFLQQTVRKLCLVASDPARIFSIFFPSLWGVPSIWRSCRLSATFFRLGGHVMQLYIGGKMLGEQA